MKCLKVVIHFESDWFDLNLEKVLCIVYFILFYFNFVTIVNGIYLRNLNENDLAMVF